MKSLNIAFGKIGKSMIFAEHRRPAAGEGAREAPELLQLLAYYNPEDKFYLVGRSDYHALSQTERDELFPNGNVIDLHMDRKLMKDLPWRERDEVCVKKLKELGIECDGAIILNGPAGSNCNVTDRVYKIGNPKEIALTLGAFQNYVAPIFYYLNTAKPPYINVACDPRYIPQHGTDLFHNPHITLAQKDYGWPERKHMKSYDDPDQPRNQFTKQRCIHSGIEVMRLGFMEPRKNIEKLEKDIKITVMLNQAKNAKNDRDKKLKAYILDRFEDVKVFGKWEDEFYEDKRFQGPKPLPEIFPYLERTKYTCLFGMSKDGWLSPKFYEMVYNGVIPFYEGNYDEDNCIGLREDVKDFLRVDTPTEFVNNIETLERNPGLYVKILKHLEETCLKPEYFTGTFVNDMVMTHLYDAMNMGKYVRPNVTPRFFEKPEPQDFSLEAFF